MTSKKVTLHPCQGWGCHEHCIVEAHTEDGVIKRVQKYRMPGDAPCNEICMKGVLSAQIPYAENRVLYPLKRVGERGEGKFERVSWDEALDNICAKINESTEKYGPRSIVLNQFWCGYPGDWHSTQNDLIYRFAFAYDASILEYQAVDYGVTFAGSIDNGYASANSRKLLRKTNNMVILWGGNPFGYTRPASSTKEFLDAQERGVKIVHISNLFDVSSAKADKWVPVKSGTDAALALGMANVIVNEGLYNEDFLLAKTAAAYLVREDTGRYLREMDIKEDGSPVVFFAVDADGQLIPVVHPMGMPFGGYGDSKPRIDAEIEVGGIPCKTSFRKMKEHVAAWTPERQEAVTGVPAQECAQLARDYIAASPATIYVYYGLRYPNGTQSNRAINLLAFLGGNFGEEGGTVIMAGNSERNTMHGMSTAAVQFPANYAGGSERVTVMSILEGFEDPTKQQHKVWLNCMGNPLLNWPNKDLWRRRILPNLDLFVCWEIRMTDTARYADYVLPETTAFERYEVLCDTDDCVIYCEPAIEPQGEAKDGAWIWQEIAKRVGVAEHFPFSLVDWVKFKISTGLTNINGVEYADDRKTATGSSPITYERLADEKAVRIDYPPHIPDDLLTMDARMSDTGRLEFYNEQLAEIGMAMADLEPIRIHDEGLKSEYPLQFYVGRHKYFMQGQFTNIPEARLLALSQFGAALNPKEARARGLRDGDMVEVFNERGAMRVPLQIRDDIPVGMAHTWYSYDETYYPDTCCPQDIMNAENTPEKETELMKKWGPISVNRSIMALKMPQAMAHVAGLTTPEGLWDNVCEVRKAEN